MNDQISAVVRCFYYNIKQLNRICASLIHDALRDAAYALVINSRIGYCNLSCLNLPDVLIRHLQKLVNAAARTNSVRSHFCCITDFVREDLHWLAIKQRIQFKALTLVYKSLHDCGPVYIKNWICHSTLATCQPGLLLPLRQNLIVPRYRKFAEQAFTVAGHLTWNNLHDHVHLPSSIQAFCKLLKVHLFNIAYK